MSMVHFSKDDQVPLEAGVALCQSPVFFFVFRHDLLGLRRIIPEKLGRGLFQVPIVLVRVFLHVDGLARISAPG